MEKYIIIPFDYSGENNLLSYMGTLEAIKEQKEVIYTNCLEFFGFAMLEKGYDVKVVKRNGDYIVLSELLTDTENAYTRRIMRKGHNATKLLLANEFTFKQSTKQEGEKKMKRTYLVSIEGEDSIVVTVEDDVNRVNNMDCDEVLEEYLLENYGSKKTDYTDIGACEQIRL